MKRFFPYFKPYCSLLTADLAMLLFSTTCIILIPLLTRRLFDFDPQDKAPFVCTVVALAAAVAGMMGGTWLNVKIGQILGARIEADMRRDLFAHLQTFSFSFFDRTKTGHLMSRITNDLSVISGLAHKLPEDLFISVITLAGAFGVMFYMNVELTVISLIPLPLLVVAGIGSKKKFQENIRQMQEDIAEINSTVENSIQGIREVQSFANEPFQQQKFDRFNGRFLAAKERQAGQLARFFSVMTGLIRCHGVLIAGVGAILCVAERLTMPDLLAFIMYARFMLLPIDRLMNLTEQVAQGKVALGRFSELMTREPEIRSKPGASVPPRIHGDISFDQVTFRYSDTADDALKNISFSAAAGTTVALVGESGAGKSTVANLLPRFYEIGSGTIRLDGTDIRNLRLDALRQQIGMVRQAPFLFDTSICENIAFGRPGASDEDIAEAARYANIYEFIQTLPAGLDTHVGEHGVKLSGGQKQRIAIARVFLKNPPVLVFDEATSALDNESERLVQESMTRLCKGRTSIIIAHRLSTILHADCIVAMRAGRIVESGSHAELLEAGGYYAGLFLSGQAGG